MSTSRLEQQCPHFTQCDIHAEIVTYCKKLTFFSLKTYFWEILYTSYICQGNHLYSAYRQWREIGFSRGEFYPILM